MRSSAVDAALSNTSTALKILKDVAEVLNNVPYVKIIAGVSVQILEIRDQIVSNKDLCYRLIDNVATRSTALIEALEKVKANSGMKDIEKDLKRYKNLLVDIHHDLLGLTTAGLANTVIKRDQVKKKLEDYSNRLTEFDSVFVFSRLVNIEAKIDRIDARIPLASSLSVAVTNLLPPPPPSSFFTGRDDVLTKMNRYFDSSTGSVACNRQRIFALYGMGGAGKTQIALKFIENHSRRFSKIYFVDASTTETLNTALENIGSNAQLPESTVDATLRWLSSLKEEWLLFLDNADDPSLDLRPFIPTCSHGNLIITSRNPEMRRYAPNAYYHVGGLEPDEAISVLLCSSMVPQEDADDEFMMGLVEELGFLALAIVQAGAFISSSPGMTFERYLQLYKVNNNKLLRENSGQRVDGYQWTVYATWEMSFCKLDSLAAQVLQLSSFWHHDKIPKVIFQRAVITVQKSRSPSEWDDAVDFAAHFQDTSGQWDELTFQGVINQLNSFSLITSYWDDCYSIHPLVHSWARDRDKTQKNQNTILAARLLALCVNDDYYPPTVSPHVQMWTSLQQDMYSGLDGELAYAFGRVYLYRGWWVGAERFLLFASERIADDGKSYVIGSLARLYRETDRPADAERLLLSAKDFAVTSYGQDDPITLSCMLELAKFYRAHDRLDEAEESQRTILEKRRKTLGAHHPDTLGAMLYLGDTYTMQDRLKEAEELQISALEGMKNIMGEDHPDVLVCINNLALTYARQKRLPEAAKMQLKALEGTKRDLGEDHIDTIVMAANLADIYVDQGRLAEAQVILEELVSKRIRIFGENHSETQRDIRSLENVKAKRMETMSIRPTFAWAKTLKTFLVTGRRRRPS